MSAVRLKDLRAVVVVARLAATPFAECIAATSNSELRKLEGQDQADRASGSNKIDWTVVGQRDAIRRERATQLLRAGDLRTVDDYLNAAIIFPHGDSLVLARTLRKTPRGDIR